MLGACNTCVRLQPRVASSGTTVDLVFVCLCIYIFCFVCLFVFVILFALVFVVLFCFASFVVVVVLGFFQLFGGWGMGVEGLIRKNTEALRGSCAF